MWECERLLTSLRNRKFAGRDAAFAVLVEDIDIPQVGIRQRALHVGGADIYERFGALGVDDDCSIVLVGFRYIGTENQ